MTTIRIQWILALTLGVVASALASPPTTDDGEDDSFAFRLDPIVLQPFLSDNDTKSSKFEEYRDLSSGMTFPLLRLYGQSKDGDRTLQFFAENAVRDDARYSLHYRQSGSYSLKLDYNLIPHRFGNDATVLWSRTGDAAWTLPDALQANLQQSIGEQRAIRPAGVNFDFLTGLIQPYVDNATKMDLSLERRRSTARIDLAKMSSFAWSAEVNHERRDGLRPYGGAFGFSNATEIPEPIDYDTTSLETSGEWRGDRAGAQFGYRYSTFRNAHRGLLYDNPWRLDDSTSDAAYTAPGAGSIDGPARGLNSLPPDNDAHSLWLTARAKLGASGYLQVSASYTAMSQNDDLLPYSINSAINPGSGAPFDVTDVENLPVRSADSKAKVLNASATAGVDLSDRIKLVGRYKSYDYNNDSGMIKLPGYVRFDAVWEDIPRVTVPYEYSRQTAEVEARYDLGHHVDLGVAYTRQSMDRKFREIEHSHDDIFSLRLAARPSRRFSLRGKFEHGRRSIGDYATEAQELSFQHPEGINNQPGLRKFDEAERTYNLGNAQLQFAASDALDLVVGFTARSDDYDKSEFGVISDSTWRVNGEINLHPSERLNLFVFGDRSDRQLLQRARQSGATLSTNPLDTWEVTFDEPTDAWGGGLTASLSSRLTFDLSGTWTNADGGADFFKLPGGNPPAAVDFANYDDSEWWVLKAKLNFEINRNISAGAMYWYDDFRVDRFAREGLLPIEVGSLLLAPNDEDYQANVFAVDLRIGF